MPFKVKCTLHQSSTGLLLNWLINFKTSNLYHWLFQGSQYTSFIMVCYVFIVNAYRNYVFFPKKTMSFLDELMLRFKWYWGKEHIDIVRNYNSRGWKFQDFIIVGCPF